MKIPSQSLNDIVGGPLPLRAPISQRANGASRLVQAADGTVTSEFLPPLEYSGITHIQFAAAQGESESDAVNALLAGVPPEREMYWMLLAYETMRRRGLWPVNLPMEQLLTEEYVNTYWPDEAAPLPAALQ